MGLPVEVNNLMLGSLGGYTVGRSLRFRASASAYLSRTIGTPSTTTNTFSAWVKRGDINTAYRPILMCTNNNSGINYQLPSTSANDTIQILDNGTTLLATSAVYRDPSAWYHIVVVWDSTNAVSTDRVRLYVNGSRVTAFGTTNYPALNASFTLFSASNPWQIGSRQFPGALYFDGYMAEINYIDGQALTASSFGAYDTNGVWQPKKYSGTYGTNGFYLPFSNTTSTTTLVQDSSGNGNNWTPNNISLTAGTTYDSMIDSPTVSVGSSNYATLNPIIPANSGFTNTFSEANQNGTITGTGGSAIFSSITMSTGAWYWETYVVNVGAGTNIDIGICSTAYPPSTMSNSNGAIGGKAGGYSIFDLSGVAYKANNNTLTAYGVTFTNGDTIMTAFDATNGRIWFGKNGTWMASGDPATAANPTFSGIPAGQYWAGFGNAGGVSRTVQAIMNFGQRPFTYTPPSGYKALNTYNLPAPSIANGAQYMAATTYTANGTTQNISNAVNGVSFQPDFVWQKRRAINAGSHYLADSLRGASKLLSSDTTAAEATNTTFLTSFNSDGWSQGTGNYTNGESIVGWQWKGGGTGVTNTSGTITSTVSANTTAGFSVVTWTGNGANATVGHGLGVAPQMIIWKNRSAAGTWVVGHTSLTSWAYYLGLQSTAAQTLDTQTFNSTAPTSSVFSLGTYNNNGQNFVAYCFSAVSGYSAFGKYTGNGSSDGPMIYTGFRPRFIMIKNATAINNWGIIDTSRDTYNGAFTRLHPNLSQADNTGAGVVIDVLSNGFKCRNSDALENQSGQTIIYAAFAEHPFNYSRAR